MEIEGEDGSRILINYGSKIDFGRGSVFPHNDDRTVSRKHISFELRSFSAKHKNQRVPDSEFNVDFEVLGRNPVCVFNSESGEIRVFRNSEKGKMACGDCFCVSARKPVLFALKRSGIEREKRGLKEIERKVRDSVESHEMAERIQSGDKGEREDEDLGFGLMDVSSMDPAKEFGFVVMGHEFDNYPKQRIRDIKDWDWFLEEPKDDSENDEVTERNGSRGKKKAKRKKKDVGNADQDWTGESDNEKVLIEKLRRGKRPKYTTRSKDLKKPIKDSGSRKKLMQKEIVQGNKEEEGDNGDEEDDDEETLGSFIVNDEDLEENLADEEEEEEEDFDIDNEYYSDDEQISEEDKQE